MDITINVLAGAMMSVACAVVRAQHAEDYAGERTYELHTR